MQAHITRKPSTLPLLTPAPSHRSQHSLQLSTLFLQPQSRMPREEQAWA